MGVLPQIIKAIPDIETLHSTVWVLRTHAASNTESLNKHNP